ncbi:uncharacterized protein [Watersipora subatra]|uniref:uncharacterized protein n=1 Tax=Watersipora subatra TaxID=2589382 RepID=UPI00355C78C9
MAYTLNNEPLPIIISTTPEVYVELTVWEEIKLFFSDIRNVSLCIIIPSVSIIYFSFILLFIIHKLRRYMRASRRKRRAARKAAEANDDRATIVDDDGSSSPYVTRISGPVFLTYHDDSSVPKEEKLYPAKSETPLYPPKPQLSAKPPRMSSVSSKPRTQIVVRCRCVGSLHEPGCHKFSLPPVAKPHDSLSASASDVSVGMRDAMTKVTSWEHQLKTNPKTQALLNKYREMRKNKAQRKWYENEEKGNWQEVPIANILERKRKMKEGNHTSLSFDSSA